MLIKLKIIAFWSHVRVGELLGRLLRFAPVIIQDGFTQTMLSATRFKVLGRTASIIGYYACRNIYRGAENRAIVKTLALPNGLGRIRGNVCDKTPSRLGFDHDYEPTIRNLLLKFQQPETIVIDAGANIGIHTVPMALAAKRSGGMVICFEPYDRVRHFLRENIRLNDVEGDVRVYESALSSEETEGIFHINPWNDGGGGLVDTGVAADGSKIVPLSKLDVSVVTLEIQTRRLDDVIAEIVEISPSTERNVSVVKVDVEGAELAVITGARALLAGELTVYHPAWVVEMSLDINDTFDVFDGAGYKCFDTVTGVVVEAAGSIEAGANMMFVHPDHPVNA
jgi:FkbM family methyltransferase